MQLINHVANGLNLRENPTFMLIDYFSTVSLKTFGLVYVYCFVFIDQGIIKTLVHRPSIMLLCEQFLLVLYLNFNPSVFISSISRERKIMQQMDNMNLKNVIMWIWYFRCISQQNLSSYFHHFIVGSVNIAKCRFVSWNWRCSDKAGCSTLRICQVSKSHFQS